MLKVLHVDNHLLFVAKPAGCPVVPDDSRDPSLLEIAKAWIGAEFHKPGNVFLGVVHRLDRPVSGVVVFARTSKAAARLTAAFRERRVEKRYLAVSARVPVARDAREPHVVEQWLRKDRARNTVTAHETEVPNAKLARTRWRVLETVGGRTLLELEPETGRSHQLRVAMATLGAPLLGDLRYGANEALPDRSVALHAHALVVPHPTRGEDVRCVEPPPSLDVWRFPSLERARG